MVEKKTVDPREPNLLYVAWRGDHQGRAMEWWLTQLQNKRLASRLVRGRSRCRVEITILRERTLANVRMRPNVRIAPITLSHESRETQGIPQ